MCNCPSMRMMYMRACPCLGICVCMGDCVWMWVFECMSVFARAHVCVCVVVVVVVCVCVCVGGGGVTSHSAKPFGSTRNMYYRRIFP